MGSILGEPPTEELGDGGPGEERPGDFCLGVVGGVKPWSEVLCCLIRSFSGFPGACLCGEGGADPCLGLGPGGSAAPIALCIWQLRQSHSVPCSHKNKPQLLGERRSLHPITPSPYVQTTALTPHPPPPQVILGTERVQF